MPKYNATPICLYKVANIRTVAEVYDQASFASSVVWSFAVAGNLPVVYACSSMSAKAFRAAFDCHEMIVCTCNAAEVKSARQLEVLASIGVYVSVATMRSARTRSMRRIGGSSAWRSEHCDCMCGVCASSLCGDLKCLKGLCPVCPIAPYKRK